MHVIKSGFPSASKQKKNIFSIFFLLHQDAIRGRGEGNHEYGGLLAVSICQHNMKQKVSDVLS